MGHPASGLRCDGSNTTEGDPDLDDFSHDCRHVTSSLSWCRGYDVVQYNTAASVGLIVYPVDLSVHRQFSGFHLDAVVGSD